ncbi:MAG: hypothetical protein KGL39_52905 [Patescibacteria group bacterium]|nr:hypothetical protein [Patescibacteria group bacterium]
MSRFTARVESSQALAASTSFANLVAGASAGLKLRRIQVGIRNTTGTPTSQQLSLAIFRATARGTATTTVTGIQMDPNSAASAITGLDTAWSANPTIAANPIWEQSFNSQLPLDIPWELLEELVVASGTTNGLAFQFLGNALPSSHLATLTCEWEE